MYSFGESLFSGSSYINLTDLNDFAIDTKIKSSKHEQIFIYGILLGNW